MIENFLRAKHWQLFLLTFGVPFVFQIIMMSTVFAQIGIDQNVEPQFIFDALKIFPVMIAVLMVVHFGWIWSTGVGLQAKVPKELAMKVNKFKFLFTVPVLYISLLTIGIFLGLNGFFNEGFEEPNVGVIVGLVTIGVLLHVFSLFCILYSIYFIAKTIKTIELQKEVSFSDFIGEFFMIWFYPVGIWFIQPRINEVINGKPSA
jgi:hypothetical protein